MTRTRTAIFNSSLAIVQKIIEMILSFIFRTVLIYTLGKEYLGLSGLFTNIFSLLSLMELGIGSAIVFMMYEPLSKNDYKSIKAYLKVYSRFYSTIGILVLIIGIVLIPVLPYIINDYDSVHINLLPIYIFTLLNVVCSYFLAHRRSLLEADQKTYINSINYSVFNILGTILRIIVLFAFKNYVLTLIITLSITIISNINIYIKTNKIYPYIREKSTFVLPAEKKQEIHKRMFAASIHQIGNVVVTSTDNIVISAYINLATVGMYSNYAMLTSMIYSMFSLIFVSITPTIGNMKINDTDENAYKIFNKLFFLNFYLYFIACTIFYALANDFILVWIGPDYIMSTLVVFLVTISLYVSGMRNTIVTFINSSGLNYNTRYKCIFEVIINLVISIILVKYIGVAGVILGTIISFVLVSVWYEPFVLFTNWFKRNVFSYYLKYIVLIFLTMITMICLNYVNNAIPDKSFLCLVLKLIVYFIALNIVIFVIFRKTEEYKYFCSLIRNESKKITRRIKR